MTLVSVLLEQEAEELLRSEAEHDEVPAITDRWYGRHIGVKEEKEIRARLAVAQLAKDADRYEQLRQQLEGIDRRCALSRKRLIKAKAKELQQQYECLSKDFPISPWRPGISADLRKWALEQRDKEPLLVWLVLRDALRHQWAFSGEIDDCPVGVLERVGAPRNRKEARYEALLAKQFHHATGDTRVPRPTQLNELEALRKAGIPARYHFASSEYDGPAAISGLADDAEVCDDCGALVKDWVVRRDGLWYYIKCCDCGTAVLEADWSSRDALVRHLQNLRKSA